MEIYITRPKFVVYLHLILVSLLIGLVQVTTWLLTNHIDILHRANSLKLGVTISLIIIPLGMLKIIWDIYLVYKEIPLITIKNDHLTINRLLTKNMTVPFNKIEKIEITGNKSSSNVTVVIKATPLKRISKKIYEVSFTTDAINYLSNNKVSISNNTKPTIYLKNYGNSS